MLVLPNTIRRHPFDELRASSERSSFSSGAKDLARIIAGFDRTLNPGSIG